MRKRDEFDERMDAIALQVGKLFHGMKAFDAASIASFICIVSIHESFDTLRERQDALRIIIKFMHERLEEMESIDRMPLN